jgi:hypothetical protein
MADPGAPNLREKGANPERALEVTEVDGGRELLDRKSVV